jgi:hypothetical protein
MEPAIRALFRRLLILALGFVGSHASEAERRLLDDLLVNYQKFERPVGNESEPVELKISLSLQQGPMLRFLKSIFAIFGEKIGVFD